MAVGGWILPLRTASSAAVRPIALKLLLAGAGLMVSGLALSPYMPMTKLIFTSTFALFSTGVSLLVFGILYLFMDRWLRLPPGTYAGAHLRHQCDPCLRRLKHYHYCAGSHSRIGYQPARVPLPQFVCTLATANCRLAHVCPGYRGAQRSTPFPALPAQDFSKALRFKKRSRSLHYG
jgi:hypothetical protein